MKKYFVTTCVYIYLYIKEGEVVVLACPDFSETFVLPQVAVLAGDYLLARASLLLARLNDIRIVQIMSGALNSMVQGEIMQVKSAPEDLLSMEFYLRTSYYKTGSLICAACTSTALLSGHAMDDLFTRKAKEYG